MTQDDSPIKVNPSAADLLANEAAEDLPTGLDMAEVAQVLRQQLHNRPTDMLRGYVAGKTYLRDALLAGLRCSVAQAELLIDSLEARGQIHFDGDDQPHGRWHAR